MDRFEVIWFGSGIALTLLAFLVLAVVGVAPWWAPLEALATWAFLIGAMVIMWWFIER